MIMIKEIKEKKMKKTANFSCFFIILFIYVFLFFEFISSQLNNNF